MTFTITSKIIILFVFLFSSIHAEDLPEDEILDLGTLETDNSRPIAILDETSEIEEKFLSLPREFLANELKCNDGNYGKFKERFETLGEQYQALKDRFEPLAQKLNYRPNYANLYREYNNLFETLGSLVYSKYKKDLLLNHGMQIENSDLGDTYRVFFEEENNITSDGKKIIRYKISPIENLNSFCKNLKNAYILLQSKNNFEVFRFYVGDISKKFGAIGKFEIPESYYKEFYTIGICCNDVVVEYE